MLIIGNRDVKYEMGHFFMGFLQGSARLGQFLYIRWIGDEPPQDEPPQGDGPTAIRSLKEKARLSVYGQPRSVVRFSLRETYYPSSVADTSAG